MKRYILSLFSFLLLVGCSQTIQFTPTQTSTTFYLENIPQNLVTLKIKDLRAQKQNSEKLSQHIQKILKSSFNQKVVSTNKPLFRINIDIIEHEAFFTLGNWNSRTRFKIKLINLQTNELINTWSAVGNAHRSNMWGYKTAQKVSEDSFNIAISDMMSSLSEITFKY